MASVRRRTIIRSIGGLTVLGFAGCAARSSPKPFPSDPVSQTTDSVQTEGDPITVERTVPTSEATVLANGSVRASPDSKPRAFDEWAKTESVRVGTSAVRTAIKERTSQETDDFEIRWDERASRLLLTTKTVVAVSGEADVAFPSETYYRVKKVAPSSVTVSLTLGDRSASRKVPVFIQAQLRRSSGGRAGDQTAGPPTG